MPGRLTALALVALAVGLVLMLGFDAAVTRIAGVLALLAFIGLGVFAIATPEFLDEDKDEDEG